MQDLIYDRPTRIADAVQLLARGDARVLAGGTDLVPQIREGRRSADRIIDLKYIPELTGVEQTPDGGWCLGAAVSVGRLGAHTAFAAKHRALLASARLIGSLQIQNRATLGGNVCNAAPSADAVPLLICHDCAVEIAGPGGQRTMPLLALFSGPGRTSLAAGEIVIALRLPPRPARSAACYLRFTPRREMDIAIAGSGVLIGLGESGTITSVRITLASVGPTPVVAKSAEQALIGQRPSLALFEAAGRSAASDARPISDTRGSADYRRELVAVLTRRALTAAVAELGITLS